MVSLATPVRLAGQGGQFGTASPIVYLDTMPSGVLFIVEQSGKASYYDGIQVRDGRSADVGEVHKVHQIGQGYRWATSTGVWDWDHGQQQLVGQLPISADDCTTCHEIDYTVSGGALYTIQHSRWLPVPVSHPWMATARHLLCTRGQLFIVTHSGILRYHQRELEEYRPLPGLRQVAVTGDRLIAATDGGLLALDTSAARTMVLDQKPIDEPITTIASVGAEGFVFATRDGVYFWSYEDYTLTQVVPWGSQHLSACYDHWGGLWLGTDRGLYKVQGPTESSPPVLLIESIAVDGSTVEVGQGLDVPLGYRSIAINYSAIDLHQSTVEVDYSIDNGDTWSPAVPSSIMLYDLPEGHHHLQLRATHDKKHYSYTAPIPLRVASPPYPIWLLALLLVALGALAWAGWALVASRRSAKMSIISRDRAVAERLAIQQEQKALQLQMNPHFLFNAITSIQGLLAQGDSRKAQGMLGTYATFMRRVLDTSRSSWYPLEQEVSLLRDYLALEQLCHGDKFDFEVSCPQELLDEDLDVLPMIVQPFVENAIEHGVTKVQHKGKISIEVRPATDPAFLFVEVKDNGPGIVDSATSSHKSVALTVVRDRLKRHHGDYQVISSDQGVLVQIKLPCR